MIPASDGHAATLMSAPRSVNQRRQLLTAGLALSATALPMGAVTAHSSAGRVAPPLPAPSVSLTTHRGQRTSLIDQLIGRSTALQLMFTGCSSTCPIQGAQFAAAAQAIEAGAPAFRLAFRPQLLSLTIDPLNDDPRAMQAWLRGFGALPLWNGATPAVRELDLLLGFLKVRATGNDRHTAQVYYFDPRGQLVLRSVDFPQPQEIAQSLLLLARGA